MSGLPRRSWAAQLSAVRMTTFEVEIFKAIERDEMITDLEVIASLTNVVHRMAHHMVKVERDGE